MADMSAVTLASCCLPWIHNGKLEHKMESWRRNGKLGLKVGNWQQNGKLGIPHPTHLLLRGVMQL